MKGSPPRLDAGDTGQRERLRYRLRLGADINFKDNWMLGVLLETNNSARSANVTLGENPFFAKGTVSTTNVVTGTSTTSGSFVTGINAKTGKPISGTAVTGVSATKGAVVSNVNFGDTLFVGRIFLKYSPWDWLTVEGGKIPNPFVSTRMIYRTRISTRKASPSSSSSRSAEPRTVHRASMPRTREVVTPLRRSWHDGGHVFKQTWVSSFTRTLGLRIPSTPGRVRSRRRQTPPIAGCWASRLARK